MAAGPIGRRYLQLDTYKIEMERDMGAKLTALLPVFNEERNIRECIDSVKWADEIFVVDSFSSDRTLEIAREFDTRIVQHEYINSATHPSFWGVLNT